MTSTPEPSAGQTPPPPAYSETADPEGHRLSAGIVALIVAAIVGIAAAVTAAIVFTQEPSPQNPPQPSPGGELVKPVASSAASQPTSQPPTGTQTPQMSMSGPGEPAGDQMTFTGQPVELQGASVTPADGWTVGDQGSNGVIIDKDDGSASILFLVGKGNSTDVEEMLSNDISAITDKLGMSNLKVTKTETGQVDSPNFQEFAQRGFMGDISTQQGTVSAIGLFVEFMNTQTGNAAFVMFIAGDEQSFDAAVDDVNSMINSML